MRRLAFFVFGVWGFLSFATLLRADVPACPVPGNWSFDANFSDEFDGDTLDEAKWYPNNPTWRGRAPGYFSKENVRVSEGVLQLMAKNETLPDLPEEFHDFTTAAVQSKERVLYGYFEVRSRPMNAISSSSFWFYASDPDEWTEIDVFEMSGAHPKYERDYIMTLHVMKSPTVQEHKSSSETWTAPFLLRDDFHRYGLLWTKDVLEWYVDDVLVRHTENTDWHQPLTINFDSETMPNWFGLPTPESLPATFKIDYIRHWTADEPSP